ncbi:hypothetical protein KI387_041813, partial [Taxus chinensis]
MESCHVSSPQTGTREPESAEAGDFHLGQLGQRYAWDARDAKSRSGRRQRRKVN